MPSTPTKAPDWPGAKDLGPPYPPMQLPPGVRLRGYVSRSDAYLSRHFDSQTAHKYLFELTDKSEIETTVYEHRLSNNPVALAIDISTMVGCPMACRFCEATSVRYQRKLSVEELVFQVASVIPVHDRADYRKIVCSFQGIGEPSLCASAVVAAGKKLLEFDSRCAISVSTLAFNLRAFSLWIASGIPFDNIQISITSQSLEHPGRLTPYAQPLSRIVPHLLALKAAPTISNVQLNYILIDGYNDSSEQAVRLAQTVKHLDIAIKVSSLNSTVAATKFSVRASALSGARAFANILRNEGVTAHVYGAFNDTFVSCGQLAYALRPSPGEC